MSVLKDRTTDEASPETIGYNLPEQSEFYLIGCRGGTWHISRMFSKSALCGARVAGKGESWRKSVLLKERICWLCQNRLEPAMIDQFRRRAGL